MTEELDWRLLDRFLAGECSAAERATVLAWLDGHRLAAQYLEAVRRTLAKRDAKPSPRRRPGMGSNGVRIGAGLVLAAGAAAVWRVEGEGGGGLLAGGARGRAGPTRPRGAGEVCGGGAGGPGVGGAGGGGGAPGAGRGVGRRPGHGTAGDAHRTRARPGSDRRRCL